MISRQPRLVASCRGAALALIPLAVPASAPAAEKVQAAATSAGWVSQLGKAGLSQYRSDPLSIPLPSLATFQAEVAAEPASTTAKLAALAAREARNATAFDAAHPLLASMLKADAQLIAGNTLSAQSVNGLLPATAYYNYLRFRRSLDPARFDHCHPNIGPMLALDARIRAGLTTPTGSGTGTPTTPGTPPITFTGQQTVGPDTGPTVPGGPAPAGIVNPPAPNTMPTVPEPASALLIAVGASVALAHRLRKARRAFRAA